MDFQSNCKVVGKTMQSITKEVRPVNKEMINKELVK